MASSPPMDMPTTPMRPGSTSGRAGEEVDSCGDVLVPVPAEVHCASGTASVAASIEQQDTETVA